MLFTPFGPSIPLSSIHSQNAVLAASLDHAREVAGSRLPVLLVGESGTGKLTLARAMHAASPRAARPFVRAVASPELGVEWMERAIQGAGEGTLYLCDFARVSRAAQELIVAAVLDRPGLCILGGTSRGLDEIPARDGRSLADSPATCREIVISLPPLRERLEDVGPLFEELLSEAVACLDRPPFKPISEEVLHRLRTHPWPGNVCELKEVACRVAWCASGEEVSREDLGLHGPSQVAGVPPRPGAASRESRVIRRNTLGALRECGGDVQRVEEKLGVGRTTVFNRLREYGVKLADFRAAGAKERAREAGGDGSQAKPA